MNPNSRSSQSSPSDRPGVRLAHGGVGLADAVKRLRRTAEAAERRARAIGRPVLAWTSAKMPRVDPVTLFGRAGLTDGDRMLWEHPSGHFGVVGLGAAWSVTVAGTDRFVQADAAWRALLADASGGEAETDRWGTGPLAMGGFAFAPAGPAGAEWEGYPPGMLVLPRCSVATVDGQSWITLSMVVGAGTDSPAVAEAGVWEGVRACADAIDAGGPGPAAGAADLSVEELLPARIWKETVRDAAAAVRDGILRKVVLARGIRVRALGLDPVRALWRLRAAYPDCTLFAVARGDRCFLGATPERLVRVLGKEIAVMAVAGSAPRGATEEEDRHLGEMLRASPKDRIEHAVVVSAVRDALAALCTEISPTPDPVLLRMRNVQHLFTPLAAVLRAPRSALELVELLHPTPAVGGVPRDGALRWIAEHERLERGWYAGPVGWMDRAGDGEFAVAIRSALLRPAEALLFAGCGIVASSDPDQEYAESSLKLQSVLSALNGG